MSRINGEVSFAGHKVVLQAALTSDPFGYDSPSAIYDAPGVVYDDGSRSRMWTSINCELLRVSCSLGGRIDQVPGVRASLGRLSAELYDPDRTLDPDSSPFDMLGKPGVGVRLVVISPAGVMTPIWTGVAETWEHNLLDGTGQLVASDLVALIAGIDLANWERPAETSHERLLAIRAMMPRPIPLVFDGTAYALSVAKFSGSLWTAVVSTSESEQSLAWVDATGTLRRLDTAGLWRAPVKATDCDDLTTPLIYTELSSLIDDEQMTNLVICDRLTRGGNDKDRDPLLFADSESILVHGPHSLTHTQLALTTDVQLEDWGKRVLDLRALPVPGISGMAITVADALPWVDRLVPAVVALDVGTVLDVTLTSRGDPGRWAVVVAGLRHTITPDTWEVDVEVSDGPRFATNPGYDHPLSVYDLARYSRAPGVSPASAERIAEAITRILEEASNGVVRV